MPVNHDERIDAVLDALARGERPPHKLTKREALAAIEGFSLSGGGGNFDARDGRHAQNLCVMQTVNLFYHAIEGLRTPGSHLTETWTPEWKSVDDVDPIIETVMVAANDNVRDEDRQRLLAYVPKLIGTSVGEKTERRARVIADIYAHALWPLRDDLYSRQSDVYYALADLGVEPESVRKDVFLKVVRDTFDHNAYSDGLVTLVYESDGMDGVCRLIDRLLRAR